jgi:hypothetical protein
MTLPTKLINILAEHTNSENMQCSDCRGSGETTIHDPETGLDFIMCESCLGSGYNQLGLIIKGILKPPEEGYGPVELQAALKAYKENLEAEQETQGEPESLQISEEESGTEWTVVEKSGFFSLVKTNVQNMLKKNPQHRKKIS